MHIKTGIWLITSINHHVEGNVLKMEGKNVTLRDYHRDTDDEDLFRWTNLAEWNYYDEPDKPFKKLDRETFETQIRSARSKSSTIKSNAHGWQIDTNDGRHIGWINYYDLDLKTKQAFIGICLPEEETWSKGFGSETIKILLDYMFNVLDLDKIKLATWSGNKRMMRCAEKCGFGGAILMPHRASYTVRGEPLERVVFSISRKNC
jgi:RimJ/RimL family protein N-acetyltransferase